MSPALATSIAVCNVGKSIGTVILADLAVGRGDNDSTMIKITAKNISRPRNIFNVNIREVINNNLEDLYRF